MGLSLQGAPCLREDGTCGPGTRAECVTPKGWCWDGVARVHRHVAHRGTVTGSAGRGAGPPKGQAPRHPPGPPARGGRWCPLRWLSQSQYPCQARREGHRGGPALPTCSRAPGTSRSFPRRLEAQCDCRTSRASPLCRQNKKTNVCEREGRLLQPERRPIRPLHI